MKSTPNQSLTATNIGKDPEAKMPPGIPYIIANELTETFSAYGMRAILVIFMTKYLFDSLGNHLFTGPQAMVWYHNYNAAADFFAVIAAIIADAFWGKYKTIIIFSIIYCFGHLALALLNNKLGLACGLTLISIGSGGIMPCVVSHLGDQFNKKNQQLLDKAYSWFYFVINVGSFISIIFAPYLLEKYGPKIAFVVPAFLMFISTIIFYQGRKVFIAIPPIGWQKYFKELSSKDNLKAIGNLAIIFIFTIVFYALYDQAGSSWVIQAEKMNRDINLGFTHITVYSSQIQAINPILILIFVPLFSYVIYPFFEKFTRVTYLKKIAAGFFVMAASYAVIARAQTLLEQGIEVGVIWQIWAFILLTMAEVLVVITSLSLSYIYSPRSMKSLALALYVLSGSLGNKLVSGVNSYLQDEGGNLTIPMSDYFWYFTYAMIIVGIIFVIYMPHYRAQVYLQKMKTSLPQRSIEHYSIIKQINDIILEVAKKKITFILLLSSIVRRGGQDDILANDYNFLIVTKFRKYAKPEAASDIENQIRNKINAKVIDSGTIKITIESIDQFNSRSEAARLFKEGIMLYDANQIKLSEPKQMTKARRLENAQRGYKHWYNKGLDFLKSYRTLKNKLSDNSLSVLFLHQAAESFYNCSLLVLTGDKPHCHELERLNYLLCMESNRFIDIFPSSTKEERECFKLLENGYVDSRYGLDYFITIEQLEYLFARIEELRDVTKEVCEKEIEALEASKIQNTI